MEGSYFFVDGSRLFSSIHEIRRTKTKYNNRKLNLNNLNEALQRKWSLNIGPLIRTIYYFKKGDNRISTMLDIPNTSQPGNKDHWRIIECGEGVKTIPDTELQKIDEKYRENFARSEKALDTRLVCDALLLVAKGRTFNIVALVNDRDYIPLFEAVQSLGGNMYLTALDKDQSICKELCDISDKYLTLDEELDNIFGLTPTGQIGEQALKQEAPKTELGDTAKEKRAG